MFNKKDIKDALIPPKKVKEIPPTLLQNCKFLKSRYEILPLLPKNAVCGEVGVLAGDFSRKIINTCSPKRLHLIDVFNCDDYKEQNRFDASNNEVYIKAKFEQEISNSTVEVHKGLSWEVLSEFPNQYFDWIYIDAAHDYDSVVKDLREANRTLKEGGIIIMNDYIMFDHIARTDYGVVQATNEFMIENKFEMIYFAFHPQLFCDVAIRKAK